MKRKLGAEIIMAATMFGAALALLLAALICMGADVYIWHRLMSPAVFIAVVTGAVFFVSLALRLYYAKNDKIESTDRSENPIDRDKRSKIAYGFKIISLACFYISLILFAISKVCTGLAAMLTTLFSALAILAAGIFAAIAVVTSRRSAAEKASFLSLLIGLPFVFTLMFIMFIVMLAVIFGILLYIMIVSWAEWGLL